MTKQKMKKFSKKTHPYVKKPETSPKTHQSLISKQKDRYNNRLGQTVDDDLKSPYTILRAIPFSSLLGCSKGVGPGLT